MKEQKEVERIRDELESRYKLHLYITEDDTHSHLKQWSPLCIHLSWSRSSKEEAKFDLHIAENEYKKPFYSSGYDKITLAEVISQLGIYCKKNPAQQMRLF